MSTKRKPFTRRSGSAKGQPVRTHGAAGTMGKKEKQMLAIVARQAFDHQAKLHRVEPGQSFDEWRHEQVMDQVGKAGLRECSHGDFRPLFAWFLQLAGREDKAFFVRLKSGKATDGAAPGDTREAREKIVHQIRCKLAVHIQLHDRTWPELLDLWTASSKRAWEQGQEHLVAGGEAVPGVDPWPGLGTKGLNKAMERKLHMEANGGPLREGYLITLAKGKTSRPNLDLGPDLYAGLADRCTLKQLTDLLATLVNRINAREGIGETAKRNKKQKSQAEKKRRSRHEIDAPHVHDPFAEARRRRGDA